ncbi:hypothetical protein G4O51_12160 [Candidatus Bathyarchaeota archaeon A05DMB-2]|jgi:hypothetical protein|nr:hypothetical protein [Candidatus Bathyarchaeota archaeon A05DMB-2]
MQTEEKPMKIRIDVDYPYPSRLRSFAYTLLGVKLGADYLKNCKTIAKMINESPKNVQAYWFFTTKTIPDKQLLSLMANPKHEIALHVVNHPRKELATLESATGKKVSYYTIHGTARLFGRILWRRKLNQTRALIPEGFPLKSFHDYPTIAIDMLCCSHTPVRVTEMAQEALAKNQVIEIHPDWLFKRGKLNPRGPYYPVLQRLLDVDHELDILEIQKRKFVKIARNQKEYEQNVFPSTQLLKKLGERDVDIFTFIERRWCCNTPSPPSAWSKTEDNIALLKVTTYKGWWENIGKKTRNMIRKAEKSGVKTEIAEPNEKLAEGIWRIYNETPIRQERAFPHYGATLQNVQNAVLSAQNCIFIGAFLQDELIGFIQLVRGDKIGIISQILSLQKHFDKAVNNALVAKAVEVCAEEQTGWIMYGRMGNHPSLDRFKENNGFTRFPLTRYYVPITRKGRIAVKLGLHREVKEVLPEPIKNRLFPVYSWGSRIQVRIRLRSGL